ncbi:hypothetical protein EDD85DRAFT_991144 [Armillaria nabsnona]|nr:hypothetical protein EDD85DRAFT_991144 [Armillaria nabsnona]
MSLIPSRRLPSIATDDAQEEEDVVRGESTLPPRPSVNELGGVYGRLGRCAEDGNGIDVTGDSLAILNVTGKHSILRTWCSYSARTQTGGREHYPAHGACGKLDECVEGDGRARWKSTNIPIPSASSSTGCNLPLTIQPGFRESVLDLSRSQSVNRVRAFAVGTLGGEEGAHTERDSAEACPGRLAGVDGGCLVEGGVTRTACGYEGGRRWRRDW